MEHQLNTSGEPAGLAEPGPGGRRSDVDAMFAAGQWAATLERLLPPEPGGGAGLEGEAPRVGGSGHLLAALAEVLFAASSRSASPNFATLF